MNSDIFNSQKEKLKELIPIVKAANKPDLTALTKFLVERLNQPDAFVVFLGETSSGKSSIINGLIGKQILPVSAKPTTGAITEVMFSNETKSPTYYSLDKLANLTPLSEEAFVKYSWAPPKDLARLRVQVPALADFGSGLRLFDTPGYNSIIDAHEEVLKDFLPNSDVVVYTVGYKIGIQNEDFVFLRYLRELLDHDVPVVLVVNRCPKDMTNSNRRIVEIKKYASDILGFEPALFAIAQVKPAQPTDVALPNNPELWRYINANLTSSKRVRQMQEAFDMFIHELFDKCNKVIKMRLATAKMDVEEIENLKKAQKEYAQNIRRAIPELIEPTFDKIVGVIPQKLSRTQSEVTKMVKEHITKSDCLDMEEEVNYINNHILPFNLQKECKETVQNYIEVELTELNRKVDDYIQKETIKFNNQITITVNTHADIAVKNLTSKLLASTGSKGLTTYVIQYGGAGGANAGIANAASHLLKKMGDFVGKTFSRSTHNALKRTLAKIGATSIKRLGGAIAVLTELLVMTYELSVWKSKACKKLEKAMDKWKREVEPLIVDDLKKLKQQNIDTVIEVAEQHAHAFDDEKPASADELPKLQKDSDMADLWEIKYVSQ